MRRSLLPFLVVGLLALIAISPLWGQGAGRMRAMQLLGGAHRAALLAASPRLEAERVSVSIDPALLSPRRDTRRGFGGSRLVIPLLGPLEGRAGSAVTPRGIYSTIGFRLRF